MALEERITELDKIMRNKRKSVKSSNPKKQAK